VERESERECPGGGGLGRDRLACRVWSRACPGSRSVPACGGGARLTEDEGHASAPCSVLPPLRVAGVAEAVARCGEEVGLPGVVALPVAVTRKGRARSI
jgi:hypothetical protein